MPKGYECVLLFIRSPSLWPYPNYGNDVTLGRLLKSFSLGAGRRGGNHVIRVGTLRGTRTGDGVQSPMANDGIKHDYVMKF